MDYNFTVAAYNSGSTYNLNDIVYVLVGSLRVYYYSLRDNNTNNTPASSPAYWTQNFTWIPSYTSAGDMTLRKIQVQFGDGYSQRQRDGINTTPVTFNLTFENRNDKESMAILHYLEQKGGVDQFIYNNATIFNRTGLAYISDNPKITFNSFGLSTINVNFTRVFEPIQS